MKQKLTKAWFIGFGLFVACFAILTWYLSTIDATEYIAERATTTPIIINDYKYIADKDEVWNMLDNNYGIKRTEDTYLVFKEIEDASRELGITNCDLLGMALKESRFNQFANGDSGYSWGVFQINSYYHDVSQRTAYMVSSATQWTYNNLIENGYEGDRVYAIARHNGSINNVNVQAYAFKVLLAAERICNLK